MPHKFDRVVLTLFFIEYTIFMSMGILVVVLFVNLVTTNLLALNRHQLIKVVIIRDYQVSLPQFFSCALLIFYLFFPRLF